MAPRLGKGFVVDRDIEVSLRDAAAGGSAALHGFEVSAARDAAADVIDDLAHRGTHVDFHEAVVDDLAGQREDLGAFALFGAHGGVPCAALADDDRDGGEGLDVVEDGGLFPEARERRERGTRTGLAALAFDGAHERGFFAADEGARAHHDFDVEVEAGIEDVLAEQTIFVGLVDRLAHALDRERVLGAAVDDAFVRADRAGADRHAFDDALRVAFKLGAVHECARVAFVGVAHDVFLVAGSLLAELPLEAGGEARAAPSADAGFLDLLDDLVGGHLGERLGEGAPAIHGDIFVDALGVDDAAVSAGHLVLVAEEVDFAEDRNH